MKKISLILVALLLVSLFTGCAGTPVIYYTDCTCPAGSHTNTPNAGTAEGAVKTGLAIVAGVGKSENAKVADYDVTVVAVTVDDKGVIQDCIIDSVGAKVNFDATGTVTSDLKAQILTKNELGDNYGMKKAGAKYEWYEQAAALAAYAKGKTVAELKKGAVNESGKAADADLATTATIYLGGYVAAIEKAVANAQHLGAQAGDTLKLAVTNAVDSSVSATADKAGTAQLDCNAVALTEKDGVITSCVLDAVQAKVSFDNKGVISTDLKAQILTKNELKEDYNMKKYGATYEWYEQAASFAKYVTGKTPAAVAGIAVNEKTVPTDADLATSVTIAVGGFQTLIAKAFR